MKLEKGAIIDFEEYIGIDYSGARSSICGLPGIRVAVGAPAQSPELILPPLGRSRHWSRLGVTEWLIARLRAGRRTIIGVDHGFSFPLAYFDKYGLAPDWESFLVDFCHYWPTDSAETTVDEERYRGRGAERSGSSRWRRRCDIEAGGAKSVFHFDVPGSVAKSTHAGLPWLLRLRHEVGPALHFWPFDGWEPAARSSVIAEVYPSRWSGETPRGDRTADEHDAWTVANWLRQADLTGTLASYLDRPIEAEMRQLARVEGWILGV